MWKSTNVSGLSRGHRGAVAGNAPAMTGELRDIIRTRCRRAQRSAARPAPAPRSTARSHPRQRARLSHTGPAGDAVLHRTKARPRHEAPRSALSSSFRHCGANRGRVGTAIRVPAASVHTVGTRMRQSQRARRPRGAAAVGSETAPVSTSGKARSGNGLRGCWRPFWLFDLANVGKPRICTALPPRSGGGYI